MARDTLVDFFQDFAGQPQEFLIYDDGFRSHHYRYDEVTAKAHAFAARLREAGIRKDDKVILYGENRPEWIIALWGCLLEAVIAVPIDYRSSPEFVERIDSIVNARAILTGDEVSLPPSCKIWTLGSLNDAQSGALTTPAIQKDQIAEIIFTSGATAEPKGVVITHRNILANILPVEREVQKYRKYGGPFFPIRFLNLLPLSHMFGQAMATFMPPMLPGIVVFMRGYNPKEIIRQIHARRVSVLVSVPQILEILRAHLQQTFPQLQDRHLSKAPWPLRWWRYRKVHRLFGWKFWSFIVGAAPLSPDLESFFTELGFVVIQGYGLTETAPIITLNHPFHARKGTVGTPIGGVEVKIAEDGEILVRGENVTTGYFQHPEETAKAFEDGWFHTGDIGERKENGDLVILGRKKEMIVTPEGLNVFPEDVEGVLNRQSGVRDCAVIGTDRVHAVLVLNPGTDPDEVVRRANTELADYQRIRTVSLWPYPEFPRTEGTGKLKRLEIAKGTPPPAKSAKFDDTIPLENLTSLERVERMVALGLDESEIVGAPQPEASSTASDFPSWNRRAFARAARRVVLPGFLLPLTRIFARIRTEGLANLDGLEPPVIFASNHQSYMDVPAILAALPPKWRYRVAPAMRKEFFHEHFHGKSFTNSLNYYLSTAFFNAFPIPQREPGALATLRYIGDLANERWCLLIFPEGRMTRQGEIAPFQPGVGMIASKLEIPVIPVRIDGLHQVLHESWRMAHPGPVRIAFGPPLHLTGDKYLELAKEVEESVRKL
ncbi:MAG TPA: AMP-binding protein [Bryobacteraceae bacterium]|nr:AMP-binding protein [Bryobacteraceae bacterium]